jgi:hypothetical protein
MRRLVIAALVAATCVVAASPGVAHAGTPCWKRVIQDWTKDGQINGHYSPKCLRQAYNNVPEDLGDYSSIKDDINAALISAANPPNQPTGGQGQNPSGGTGKPGGGGNAQQKTKQAQERAEKVVPHAGTNDSIPESSRTLPLPLLILAAVVLAALLAAASPPLIQRVRARLPRGRAAPQPDR